MTTPLLNVGKRFQAKYKTVTGMEFFGQFLDIPDTSRVSNFLSARRYLRTTPSCALRPADVVIANGEKFIAAEHGTGWYVIPIYKHFKMFQVDEEPLWYGTTTVENSVTGVKEMVRDVVGQKIYMSTQPHSSQVDDLKIPSTIKVAVTNAPVKIDDKVGGFVVTKADHVLGITLLELKEV